MAVHSVQFVHPVRLGSSTTINAKDPRMTPDQLHTFSTFVAGAVYLGLMVLSAAQGFRSPVYSRFFLLALSLFVWNAGFFVGGPGLASRLAYGLVTGGVLLFCFALVDFMHSFLGLAGGRRRRILRATLAVSLLSMAALATCMALVRAGRLPEAPTRLALDYEANALSLVALGYSVTVLALAMARTSSAPFRNRLKFVAAALGVGLATAAVNLGAKLAGHPELPAARIGMLVATAIAAYAIFRGQALEFELALRRAFALLFYAGVCLAGAMLLAGRFQRFGREALFLAGIVFGFIIWALPAAILERLTRPLRRLLYPERFGPHQAALDFAARSAAIVSLPELARALSKAARRMTPHSAIRLLMRSGGEAWRMWDEETFVAPAPELAGLMDRLPERPEPVIVEDLERAGDRLSPDSPRRERLAELAQACRRARVDLAIGAGELPGPGLSILVSRPSDQRRLESPALSALEALVAEGAANLQRIELLDRIRRSERLAALGEMASSVAHEIKNPLSAIRGAAQALLQRPQDEGRAELAAIIAQETNRLDALVNEFLAFSQETRLDLAPTRVDDLVAKTLRLCRMRADFWEIETTADAADGLPAILADEEKLHQALLNLIGNAAEALSGRGAIAVRAAREGDWIVVEVSDDGPGVSEEVRARLFEPFFTTKPRGVGLGLAISRKIVEAHGGRLDYRPQAPPARGSVFTMRLPIQEKGE
ncbi:MAG: ATP-binding protein [Candidatus Sumerlaeota bacterium]|nr:ATP-binding protein [Candidatus Sumerlaeota bacterium]